MLNGPNSSPHVVWIHSWNSSIWCCNGSCNESSTISAKKFDATWILEMVADRICYLFWSFRCLHKIKVIRGHSLVLNAIIKITNPILKGCYAHFSDNLMIILLSNNSQISFICNGCGNTYSRLPFARSWFAFTCNYQEQ